MISPISSLANMEMALYGGIGSNSMAPSYVNGYAGGGYSSYMNPSFYGNPYNTTFAQNVPSNYSSQVNTQQTQPTVFQGLTSADTKALSDDYLKSLTPSEGFIGCATSNALFAAAMNPRLIAHPVNTFRAVKETNKAFASVKQAGSPLNKLWVGTGANAAETAAKNSNILREAWLQHNKALARCESKLGLIRRSYAKTGDVDAIKAVVKDLEGALARGDMKAITEHTAKLQHAYSANGGAIPRGWNKVKGLFSQSKPMTVAEKLKDTAGIAEKVKALESTTATGYKDMIKRGGGVKGALLFAGLEFILGAGKIKTAFQKDNETGWKQVGQTTVRGLGNAAGWTLGEAAGMWAFTKWGAKIGSKVNPLVGTLIGGAVGLVGGGLGMWLAGKGTKALVGDDVADKIEAQKLASTQEGQVQLLQNTLQRLQAGEKVSPEAQLAVQKVLTQMA